jgi:hypothetical protein
MTARNIKKKAVMYFSIYPELNIRQQQDILESGLFDKIQNVENVPSALEKGVTKRTVLRWPGLNSVLTVAEAVRSLKKLRVAGKFFANRLINMERGIL